MSRLCLHIRKNTDSRLAMSHEHYRVRWDERHESIVHPSEGTTFLTPEEVGAR